jgi:hypothetical protein
LDEKIIELDSDKKDKVVDSILLNITDNIKLDKKTDKVVDSILVNDIINANNIKSTEKIDKKVVDLILSNDIINTENIKYKNLNLYQEFAIKGSNFDD